MMFLKLYLKEKYSYISGYLGDETILKYKGNRDLGATFIRNVRSYSFIAGTLLDRHVDRELEKVIDKLRAIILSNHTVHYSIQQALDWVDNMTSYIDQIDLVKVDLAEYITEVT